MPTRLVPFPRLLFGALGLIVALNLPGMARAEFSAPQITAVTVEGGPIWTTHLQSGDPGFREEHGFGVLKVATAAHGAWGRYLLTPNSVDHTTLGLGYVTPTLELSAAFGLAAGYQDHPLPLVAGHARWVLYATDAFSAGLVNAYCTVRGVQSSPSTARAGRLSRAHRAFHEGVFATTGSTRSRPERRSRM